jgi:hypothetical protein
VVHVDDYLFVLIVKGVPRSCRRLAFFYLSRCQRTSGKTLGKHLSDGFLWRNSGGDTGGEAISNVYQTANVIITKSIQAKRLIW